MRVRSLLSALLIGPSLIACSVLAGDSATSESDHTEGDPTFAQYGWLWADETETEFRKNAEATPDEWMGAAEFLPLEHPMTQRLQFWVDRLDEALRTAHPQALRATPKPRLIIRKTPEPNAWVSGMPVSWNVKTQHAGGASLDAGEAGAGEAGVQVEPFDVGDAAVDGAAPLIAPAPVNPFILLSTGNIWANDVPPLERPHDAQQLLEFRKFHNDGFSKCRITAAGETLVLGTGCKRYSNVTADRADRLTFYATGKFLTITTGYLLTLLDEDKIVSTLAHELGHFYRSHVNMPSDVVNFFYVLDETKHTHKPAPDPRSLEQTVAVREKLRGEEALDFTEENLLMSEKGLGFYTTEQEADELAVELMAKIGLPGGVLIEKLLTVQKSFEQFEQFNESGTVKWAACSALRERGFKDENGAPVSVPVGDLSDPHHSNCFRIMNVAREIAAHDYKLGERPAPPGEAWSRLITRLGAEVEPPAPPADADAGAADGGLPAPADAGGGG